MASMATDPRDTTHSDEMVQINLYVPRYVKEQLDEAAWRERLSRRALGLKILTDWLNRSQEGTNGG